MSRNVIETVMGAVVIAVAALFLVFAYRTADLGAVQGYEVQARFGSTGGLQAGADVRISGVRVGSVVGLTLDPATYLAVIRMSIDPSIRLPEDTVAAIRSESLLGGRYLSLAPGGAEDLVEPGGFIQYTENPVDLEDLLGRFIFSSGQAAPAGQTPAGSGADAGQR
jgi:phospholipid/cholesterol/gamma-HCH transport system substrate-binding protein